MPGSQLESHSLVSWTERMGIPPLSRSIGPASEAGFPARHPHISSRPATTRQESCSSVGGASEFPIIEQPTSTVCQAQALHVSNPVSVSHTAAYPRPTDYAGLGPKKPVPREKSVFHVVTSEGDDPNECAIDDDDWEDCSTCGSAGNGCDGDGSVGNGPPCDNIRNYFRRRNHRDFQRPFISLITIGLDKDPALRSGHANIPGDGCSEKGLDKTREPPSGAQPVGFPPVFSPQTTRRSILTSEGKRKLPAGQAGQLQAEASNWYCYSLDYYSRFW